MPRQALTPADDICAFGAMSAKGATVPDIVLAFAALPAPVIDALAAGEIILGTAKAFTLSE